MAAARRLPTRTRQGDSPTRVVEGQSRQFFHGDGQYIYHPARFTNRQAGAFPKQVKVLSEAGLIRTFTGARTRAAHEPPPFYETGLVKRLAGQSRPARPPWRDVVMSTLAKIEGGRESAHGHHYSPGDGTVPEWLEFSTGVALTVALPPFLYCAPYGEFMLFGSLMLFHTVGGLLGFALSKRPAEAVPSWLPVDRTPRVSSYAGDAGLKKAA